MNIATEQETATVHCKILFVYGTLKRGYVNHAVLANAAFIGVGITLEPYQLVIADKRNVPTLIDEVGNGLQVHGELFSITPSLLDILDRFEDVGKPSGYVRRPITIEAASSRQTTAWAYMKSRDQIGVIKSSCLGYYSPNNEYISE